MKEIILCAVFFFGIASATFAQDAVSRARRSILQPEQEAAAQPAKFDETKYLTDDWGGYRTQLRNAGLEVFGFYNNIISGNVSGGRDEGHATYDHDIWVGMKFDLETLAGWRGGQFVISGINREGPDLTTKYIGSIFSTQQLVGGQRTFLYQVFLQQKLAGGDQLTLKMGRFGASDGFLWPKSCSAPFSLSAFSVWASARSVDPKGMDQDLIFVYEPDGHEVIA